MIDRSLNYGRNHVANFLNKTTFSTVLDLGAGQGSDLDLAVKANPNASVHAIEVYPEYAKILSNKDFTVHSINIEREQIPLENESVDVIIMNQLLEHTKEVFWIFEEISRVLRVNGRLILGVPNLASLHNRLLLAFGRQPSPIKTRSAHVRGFTRNDLVDFLETVWPGGYSLVDFGGGNFYPFPPILAKPLAGLLPNFAWSIFLLLEKNQAYQGQFVAYPPKENLETNFWLGPEKSNT